MTPLGRRIAADFKKRFRKIRTRALKKHDICVEFDAPNAALGTLSVYAGEGHATLFIGDLAHGHFGSDEISAETASKALLDFLNDLFHDEVVVWANANQKSGGWFYAKHAPKRLERGTLAFLWSGPFRP